MDGEATLRRLYDKRGFLDTHVYGTQWRTFLRNELYEQRNGLSDVSKKPLKGLYDCHEGLFSRRFVSKASWQELLFSGVNCFLLSRLEHMEPPTRTECYWIAVTHWGVADVDWWIKSLPFKSTIDAPWRETDQKEVLFRMASRYKALAAWEDVLDSLLSQIRSSISS